MESATNLKNKQIIKKTKKKIILLWTYHRKVKLALDIAKEFDCEIVNADGMQVYKEVKFYG